MADCRDWVLLTGGEADAVVWLQSLERPEVALAAVSPRRFLSHYQLWVDRGQMAPLHLEPQDTMGVLAVVAEHEGSLTVNLKSPLVINTTKALGCQVVVEQDAPLQYMLDTGAKVLRKSA